MSKIIMVMGRSGSGKSTAMRTLDPASTFVINIINKDLPFRNAKQNYQVSNPAEKRQGNRKILFYRDVNSKTYSEDKTLFAEASSALCNVLKNISDRLPHIKTIVIDDSQYIMSYEFIARAKEKGFEKYNEIAQNFFNILTTAQSLREDIDVFFLHHSEFADNIERCKTLGKLLDNVLTLEGVFDIVLYATSRRSEGKTEYYFCTNNNGESTAKSPDGMFPAEIPNDLLLVKNSIKEY